MINLIPSWQEYLNLTIQSDHLVFYFLKNSPKENLSQDLAFLAKFDHSAEIFNHRGENFDLSPVGLCIMNGMLSEAELMIKNGGNARIQNENNNTLLHFAALEGKPRPVLEFLIEQKVNLNIQNNQVKVSISLGKYSLTPCSNYLSKRICSISYRKKG